MRGCASSLLGFGRVSDGLLSCDCGHTLLRFPPAGIEASFGAGKSSRSACYDLGLRHLSVVGCPSPHLSARVSWGLLSKTKKTREGKLPAKRRGLVTRLRRTSRCEPAAPKCPAPVRSGTASTRSRPNYCRDSRRRPCSNSNSSTSNNNLRCLPRGPRCNALGEHRQRRRPSTLTARNAAAAVASVPDEDDQIWTSGYHRAAPGGPSRKCASSRSWRKVAC